MVKKKKASKKRLKIYISPIDGIYVDAKKHFCYWLKQGKKRERMIQALRKNRVLSGGFLATYLYKDDYRLLTKEINDINLLFAVKLHILNGPGMIISNPGGGYSLNHEAYDFVFLDD